MRMPNDAPVNDDTNAAPALTYTYAMQAKRHAEVMDALHTIGRNIAQQDATHRRIALAIEDICAVLMSFGGVFVVLAMVAIAMVLR